MKTTLNHKNTEYRISKVGNTFEVWLVSFATGKKLKRVAQDLSTEESAEEFKKWVKRKRVSRKEIIKLCEGYGLTNVCLYYSRGEGWWIESDQFDEWISMDSYGAILALNRKFKK